jgi:predicted nucleic acid-binding protein
MTSRIDDVVVCDASPLIVLARVGHLDLLHQLFGRVLVPPAVWSEVTRRPDAPGAAAVARAEWLQVRAPQVVPATKLGLGEREAMALAAELHAILIVDDGLARAAALAMGITITGTLGVLRRAKYAGLLVAVRPILDEMQANGLRVAEPLVHAFIQELGE